MDSLNVSHVTEEDSSEPSTASENITGISVSCHMGHTVILPIKPPQSLPRLHHRSTQVCCR